jgi:hypothetical protein
MLMYQEAQALPCHTHIKRHKTLYLELAAFAAADKEEEEEEEEV